MSMQPAKPCECIIASMPEPGIEPGTPYGEQILSLPRLPISPFGRRARYDT